MIRKTAFVENLEKVKPSPLLEGFMACTKDRAIINLGTAENRLIDDKLLPIIRNRPEMTEYHLTYGAAANETPLREAICALYRDHFGIADAEPSQIMFGSGIAFLVERLGLVLCEPGDIVLIPKPCYGQFEPDLQMARAKVVYIDLDNLPDKPPAGSKMLLLTNPGNPIGDIIPNQDQLLKWAYQEPELHIVTDDVYALSNRCGEKYQSIAGRADADPMRVHQLYGVSKDWGLAGLHVGFFWTRNQDLMKMMRAAQGMFCLSSDTQWLITRIIGDKVLRDEIIQVFRERLTRAAKVATEKLTEGGVKVDGCDNSLFLMIDLRDIAGKDQEEELHVWRELLHKYKVHVLPGASGFYCSEFGRYRVIISVPDEMLLPGIERIVKGVQEIRAARK